jgi:hypothetical protein
LTSTEPSSRCRWASRIAIPQRLPQLDPQPDHLHQQGTRTGDLAHQLLRPGPALDQYPDLVAAEQDRRAERPARVQRRTVSVDQTGVAGQPVPDRQVRVAQGVTQRRGELLGPGGAGVRPRTT